MDVDGHLVSLNETSCGFDRQKSSVLAPVIGKALDAKPAKNGKPSSHENPPSRFEADQL